MLYKFRTLIKITSKRVSVIHRKISNILVDVVRVKNNQQQLK